MNELAILSDYNRQLKNVKINKDTDVSSLFLIVGNNWSLIRGAFKKEGEKAM